MSLKLANSEFQAAPFHFAYILVLKHSAHEAVLVMLIYIHLGLLHLESHELPELLVKQCIR